MSQTAIFWPMIMQTVLIYGVYILIGLRRRDALKAGSTKASQFRENLNEPPESLFVRNNLANQFELPVLFYAACLALHAVGGADPVAVVLAWLFVISRYVHAWIHVTTNRIRHRRPAFTAGFVLLALMWIWLGVSIL